jgi:CBS domain-containing protein
LIEEVARMGFFTTIAAFVGGYVAGAKMGDRPLEAVKESLGQAKERASSLASGAGEMAKGATRLGVDLRAVREVMTSPVESVGLDALVAEAAKAMQRGDIGDVLVLGDKGEVRGIITDRDLAIRSLAEDRDPATTSVEDVMTPIAATVEPSATVTEALELMRRYDVRRLPVVEGGKAVGIITLGDLSRSGGAGAALADISTAPANT